MQTKHKAPPHAAHSVGHGPVALMDSNFALFGAGASLTAEAAAVDDTNQSDLI